MFRARMSGFFVGFGVAGVLAAYQIRNDILKSHDVLLEQVDKYRNGLERRVASLEAIVAQQQTAPASEAPAPAQPAPSAAPIPTPPQLQEQE